jgi:hypothetical protein
MSPSPRMGQRPRSVRRMAAPDLQGHKRRPRGPRHCRPRSRRGRDGTKTSLGLVGLVGLLAALLGLVSLAALLVPVTPVAVAGVACIGAPANNPAAAYPEQRQFVENQTWWTPGPGQTGPNQGHVHLGACIPERETLRANFTMHVRVVMHDNPGKANYVSMVFKGPSYEATVQKLSLGGMTCPVGTCEKWLTFTGKIAGFQQGGLQEIRFRGFVPEPSVNGQTREMRANLNFQVYVSNGKARADVTRMPWLRGKGWYTHTLYCEASLRSVPVPDGPVSGVWRPTVAQATHSTDASLPVTHHTVRLDPNFHASPPDGGTVVVDGNGPRAPTQLAIDTTTLTNGTHKLFQRADCRDDKLGSTNRGVLVVPFVVRNPQA